MQRKVKILLYGSTAECRRTAELLHTVEHLSEHHVECNQTDDEEIFVQQLVGWNPSLVIVLADGADGMECVTQTKLRLPDTPVFWFSDDRRFGMHAYRVNCAYFSVKPVEHKSLGSAFQRCDHVGIRYETT